MTQTNWKQRALDAEHTLEDFGRAGWRSCIDHIIKPESKCPVCLLELRDTRILALECIALEVSKQLDKSKLKLQDVNKYLTDDIYNAGGLACEIVRDLRKIMK